MLKNFSNKLFVALVATLLATTSAYAIPKAPCDTPKKVCCEEPAPGPCTFNYPKDVGLSCPRDFYLYADLLVMQAKEDGLDVGITQTGAGNGDTSFPLQGGNILSFSSGSRDWDWNLGFRVGMGFYLNRDAWNIDAVWTYYRIKDTSTFTIQGDGELIPFWIPSSAGGDTDDISARWKAKYNTFDFKFGKPHYISRYFILNPHIGLRFAWIDQNFVVRHGNEFAGVDKPEVLNKNDFWGIGIRGGLDLDFLIGAGFNFFGNLAASILYGKFDLSQESALGSYTFNIEKSFYDNVPNLEAILGLCWSTLFDQDRYKISLKVAYEFHQWWDQNRLRRFYNNVRNLDEVSRGDLTLNGFSFRILFDF